MKYIALVKWNDVNDCEIRGLETIPFQTSKTLKELRGMPFDPIDGQIRLNMTKFDRAMQIDSIEYMTPNEWFESNSIKDFDLIIKTEMKRLGIEV